MSEKNILDVRHANVRKAVVTTVLPDGTKTVSVVFELVQANQNIVNKGKTIKPKISWFGKLTARLTRTGFYQWLSGWLSSVFGSE